ncbi:hypothetical protein MXB_3478 [Myxobolus squamalis]|nr:hypothetical protein MXB_3478 [Myxobolus squamalis]
MNIWAIPLLRLSILSKTQDSICLAGSILSMSLQRILTYLLYVSTLRHYWNRGCSRHLTSWTRFNETLSKTFVVLLSHHFLIPAFGPHAEYSGDNFLNNILNKSRFHLSLSGHNHNFQYVPKGENYLTSYFTVGNGAKKAKASKNYVGTSGWHYDKSGGFATLLFEKDSVKFTFLDENNAELKSVTILA